ncbi:MAG: hypothetical protein ACRDYZ_00795, partial [Acidimicrobiales bacterium]
EAMARFSSGGSTGEGSTSAAPTWTTGWQRVSQTFLRPARKGPTVLPPEPDDYSRLTDDEKRSRIVRVDPLERKLGTAAAVFAAVVAVYESVPYMVSKVVVATMTKPVGRHCPNHLTYTTHGSAAATCNGVYPVSHYAFPLAVWLVLALAIFVTARIGRRSALAFTAGLTGISFGTYLMLPFIFLAGWILLRGWRTQKYGAPNAKSARPGYAPPVGRGTTRRTRTARGGKSTTGNGTGPGNRKPPEANKRYTPKTPPKPAKKRVPPAR